MEKSPNAMDMPETSDNIHWTKQKDKYITQLFLENAPKKGGIAAATAYSRRKIPVILTHITSLQLFSLKVVQSIIVTVSFIYDLSEEILKLPLSVTLYIPFDGKSKSEVIGVKTTWIHRHV